MSVGRPCPRARGRCASGALPTHETTSATHGNDPRGQRKTHRQDEVHEHLDKAFDGGHRLLVGVRDHRDQEVGRKSNAREEAEREPLELAEEKVSSVANRVAHDGSPFGALGYGEASGYRAGKRMGL